MGAVLFVFFVLSLFAGWIVDNMDLNFNLGLDMILSQVDVEDFMDTDSTGTMQELLTGLTEGTTEDH